nr:hypothetical protein [Tanacetum cinerariifolium]
GRIAKAFQSINSLAATTYIGDRRTILGSLPRIITNRWSALQCVEISDVTNPLAPEAAPSEQRCNVRQALGEMAAYTSLVPTATTMTLQYPLISQAYPRTYDTVLPV